MSKIQNSTEIGGWDVWVTHAGGNPDESGDDEFVGTAPTLAQAAEMLLSAILQEEKEALIEASAKLTELETRFGARTFDVLLAETLLNRRAKDA